ncbi:MAG: RAQPRD family integrative conjugative element protein [Gammaproteobacteria bacterium]|nr:RAQPRD family integrative conjugative element protein [Gammaproteobacteria bacterium]
MKLRLMIMMFTLMVVIPAPVLADAESERANLVRLVGEFDYLLQSLRKYKIDSVNDQYTFSYDALSHDLTVIRDGVTEYINKDLSLTREIAPLVGQYIQQPIHR